MVPRDNNYTVLDLYPEQSLDAYFSSVPQSQQSVVPNGFTESVDPAAIQDGAVNASLESPDFKTGVSGWQINVDGSVEFNDGTFRGALTATTIDIGGADATSFHVDINGNLWLGDAAFASAPFKVSNAGALTASSVTITGGTIGGSTTVGIGNVNLAARGWTHTCVFSVTDSDTIAWASGTFTSADGTAYSISSGNTGNMAAKTYIYLDIAISTTAFQTTTTAATAVGAGKVLLAVAQNNTTEAVYQSFGGPGGQNIDAASIVAGSITANEIQAATITAAKLTVSQLSAIAADLGAITAGSIVLPSGGFIRSGQTAFNTGTGFYIGNDSGTPKLSIGNPSGRYLTWDGTNFTINGYVQNSIGAFGGDGSDGALSVSSGTTNVDLAGSAYVVKNYTSISITGTGKVTFINPHASGSIIILKSQGAVTLTSSQAPMLDASACGAAGATGVSGSGSGSSGRVAGADGTDGTSYSLVFTKTNKGTGGTAGGAAGAGGAAPTLALNATSFYASSTAQFNPYANLWTASGGGAGSYDHANPAWSATQGSGGNGGGTLVVECAGAFNFTTAAGISVAGAAGTNGVTSAACAGGGGGGAGGYFLCLYNTLTANSGTVTVAGGTGGNASCTNASGTNGAGAGANAINAGSSGSGTSVDGTKTGGDGGTGASLISQNKFFT